MTNDLLELPDNVVWTPDCDGKQDLDGTLIHLDCRYWPRGGGYVEVSRGPNGVEFRDSSTRPNVKPSAAASVYCADNRLLARKDFEFDTEEEVKQAVEQWAKEQFNRIVRAVRSEFGIPE